MPTNLYGPGDNYHPENSHVIPALIRRFHEAKVSNIPEVVIWGTGTARREFLYVDDMASASVFLMNLEAPTHQETTEPMQSHINVGYGADVTIFDLARTIASALSYEGHITFDVSKPDGSPRKFMDCTTLNKLGWKPNVGLEEGIKKAYENYLILAA